MGPRAAPWRSPGDGAAARARAPHGRRRGRAPGAGARAAHAPGTHLLKRPVSHATNVYYFRRFCLANGLQNVKVEVVVAVGKRKGIEYHVVHLILVTDDKRILDPSYDVHMMHNLEYFNKTSPRLYSYGTTWGRNHSSERSELTVLDVHAHLTWCVTRTVPEFEVSIKWPALRRQHHLHIFYEGGAVRPRAE